MLISTGGVNLFSSENSLSSTSSIAFFSASTNASFLVSLNFLNSATLVASSLAKYNSVFNLATFTAVSAFLSITADERDDLLERDLAPRVFEALLLRLDAAVREDIALSFSCFRSVIF